MPHLCQSLSPASDQLDVLDSHFGLEDKPKERDGYTIQLKFYWTYKIDPVSKINFGDIEAKEKKKKEDHLVEWKPYQKERGQDCYFPRIHISATADFLQYIVHKALRDEDVEGQKASRPH